MTNQKFHNLKRLEMQTLQKQHDAVSRSINRTLLLLVGFSLFCILTLGAEDASLLRTDATITMPFAGTQISFVAFLVIGPAVLIALTIYLHVFVEYWNSLGGRQLKCTLPFIQNIQTVGAKTVSVYLIYWLTPTALTVFAWKALPRPEGPWLIIICSIVAATMAWLQIYRHQAPLAKWLKRIWILVPIAFVALFIIQAYYHMKTLFTTNFLPSASTGFPTDPPKEYFPRRLFERQLQLRGADLSEQTFQGINLKNANLSSAKISKTMFEGTNFANAELEDANLAKSNFKGVWLNGANLKYANLSGMIIMATVFRNANLENANLAGSLLIFCDLKYANLRNADLSGANIMMSFGLTCEQLSQANRWWEAGRNSDLACGRKIPVIKYQWN